jgi:predicted secreted Zn-dependent protease
MGGIANEILPSPGLASSGDVATVIISSLQGRAKKMLSLLALSILFSVFTRQSSAATEQVSDSFSIAEATIIERASYYSVEGTSEQDLVRGMNTNGPTDGTNTFWAWTHGDVAWTFDTATQPHGCRIKTAGVSLGINFVYPLWTPPPGVKPQGVAKWSTMMTAMIKHEHEHALIDRAAANALVTLMRGHYRAKSCGALETYLKREGSKILERRDEENQTLDIRTNHGRLEGVAMAW